MHPAIVSRDEYKTVGERAAANNNSRRAGTAQVTGSRTEYLYRGLLRCGICGLRMTGNIRYTGRKYYFCYPHKQRGVHVPQSIRPRPT
jgi:hypothetical protein